MASAPWQLLVHAQSPRLETEVMAITVVGFGQRRQQLGPSPYFRAPAYAASTLNPGSCYHCGKST